MIWQILLIIPIIGLVDGVVWGATRWTLSHLGRRRTLTRRELNALVEGPIRACDLRNHRNLDIKHQAVRR